MTIQSTPDQHYAPKPGTRRTADAMKKKAEAKAGYLLITRGQDTGTARLTAVAGDTSYIGGGWCPVTGLTAEQSKALAVFLNSTPGRLLLMRNPGRKLVFPNYTAGSTKSLPVPDFRDSRILDALVACWQETRDELVPQFRDGDCKVRRSWDDAVAEALDWDREHLTRLRLLLAQEPHVRGLARGEYAD